MSAFRGVLQPILEEYRILPHGVAPRGYDVVLVS
jgi:hypothetical protein